MAGDAAFFTFICGDAAAAIEDAQASPHGETQMPREKICLLLDSELLDRVQKVASLRAVSLSHALEDVARHGLPVVTPGTLLQLSSRHHTERRNDNAER